MNNIERVGCGYIRVSTEEQAQGLSLDNQKEAIANYAKFHNIKIVRWFEDPGISAKTARLRPGLQTMLQHIIKNKGEIDVVVVYDLTRLSRDMMSFSGDILPILSSSGVSIESTREPVDDTPIGKFIMNLGISFAQLDNDTKSELVKDNMKTNAKNGWWQTSIPVGFLGKKIDVGIGNNKKRKTHTILIPNNNNNEAANITWLLNRYAEGDVTVKELAELAAQRGIKRKDGRPITYYATRTILTNTAYCGYICSKKLTDGEMVKANFDGLISLETFNRIQRLLGKQGRGKYNSKNYVTNEMYPLKGILICPLCHTPLRGTAPTDGSGKPSPRYCCNTKGHGSISTNEAHSLFNEFLYSITPTDEAIKLFKTIVNKMLKKQVLESTKIAHNIQEQIDKIEQRKINTLCKFADGTITAEEKDLIVNKCNSDMSYKQLELDEANSHKLITESQVEYVCNFMTMPAKMWRDAGFESKVALEKMIFPNGLEFDIKARKFGTEQISPIFSVISPKKSPKGSNNDVWCARYDSNVRPSVPQTDALSS